MPQGPTEYDLIHPPAGVSPRALAGRTVLDLQDVALVDADGGIAPTAVQVGGTGTGQSVAAVSINKTAAGVADFKALAAGVLRARMRLDASENLIISLFASDGTTEVGTITIAHTTGLITLSKGTTITTGGLTISAGGLTVTAGGVSLVAGNMVLTAGVRAVLNVPAAADDAAAAALSPPVPIGGLYHVAGDVKTRLS